MSPDHLKTLANKGMIVLRSHWLPNPDFAHEGNGWNNPPVGYNVYFIKHGEHVIYQGHIGYNLAKLASMQNWANDF